MHALNLCRLAFYERHKYLMDFAFPEHIELMLTAIWNVTTYMQAIPIVACVFESGQASEKQSMKYITIIIMHSLNISQLLSDGVLSGL